MQVRRLTEENKEEEELVDVAPHRGEPRISCVVVALCIMVVMLLMRFMLSAVIFMLDASDIVS
jgi:hypothetical protein